MSKIIPYNGFVLCKRLIDSVNEVDGIVLPTFIKDYEEFEVVDTSRINDDVLDIHPGDKIFTQTLGTSIDVDGVKYNLISIDKIIAKEFKETIYDNAEVL